MKKIIASVCVLFIFGPLNSKNIEIVPFPEINHSGRTDKCGCHFNRKTEEYHCHNRKQRGGDCPE